MTQTKYPISKIRSGEVAVRLTDIEQFKKIAPEQDDEVYAFKANFYHAIKGSPKKLTWLTNYYANSRACEEIKIDFHQIDWEEVKEETVEEAIKREYEARKFNSDFPFEPQSFKIGAKWQKEQLDKELSSLKAENERLSKENEGLKAENEEVYRQLKLRESSKSSQPQELTLQQRMAWEYLKENPQVGVEKSFKYIDNFLNYKGGNDEQ